MKKTVSRRYAALLLCALLALTLGAPRALAAESAKNEWVIGTASITINGFEDGKADLTLSCSAEGTLWLIAMRPGLKDDEPERFLVKRDAEDTHAVDYTLLGIEPNQRMTLVLALETPTLSNPSKAFPYLTEPRALAFVSFTTPAEGGTQPVEPVISMSEITRSGFSLSIQAADAADVKVMLYDEDEELRPTGQRVYEPKNLTGARGYSYPLIIRIDDVTYEYDAPMPSNKIVFTTFMSRDPKAEDGVFFR